MPKIQCYLPGFAAGLSQPRKSIGLSKILQVTNHGPKPMELSPRIENSSYMSSGLSSNRTPSCFSRVCLRSGHSRLLFRRSHVAALLPAMSTAMWVSCRQRQRDWQSPKCSCRRQLPDSFWRDTIIGALHVPRCLPDSQREPTAASIAPCHPACGWRSSRRTAAGQRAFPGPDPHEG